MRTIFSIHFILFSLTSFFFVTANHFYDLLPKHFDLSGFTAGQTGFIMSFTGIGGMLALPILLYVIDRYTRKSILTVVLIAHALIPILYLCDLGGNNWYALPRLLQGSMAAAAMITLTTVVSYVIPKEKRSKGFALYGVINQVGLILSIATGEFVYDSFGFTALYIYSAVLFLAPLLFIRKLPEHGSIQVTPRFTDFKEVLSQKRIYPVVFWIFIHGAVYGTFLSFMPSIVLSAGLNYVKPFYIAFSVMVALVRLIFRNQFDKYERKTVLLLPLSIIPFSLWLMPFVDSYLLLTLVGLIYGFCNGIMFPVLTATLIDYSPFHFRGRMSVLFQLFFNLGISLSAFIGGKIAETSVELTFFVMGLFTFSGVVVLLISKKDNRPAGEA